ncbi:MAG TPA: sugar transferase [Syntrophorhabdaceae bacterium]|nr:sugar transferase [Syntrophorhabdaceae bacterium]
MIREREKYYGPFLFFLDSISAFISYSLSLYFYLVFFHPHILDAKTVKLAFYFFDSTLHLIPFLVVLFLFFNQFIRKNDYTYKRRVSDVLYQILSPVFITIATFLFLSLTNPLFRIHYWFLAIYGVLLCGFLFIDRIIILLYIIFLQKKGNILRFILIVGTNHKAINVARLFEDNPQWGLKVVGLLTYDMEEVGNEVSGLKVLGFIDDIAYVLEKNVVDYVLLVQEKQNIKDIQNLALRCKTIGIDFVFDTNIFARDITDVSFDHVNNTSLVLFRSVWLSPEKLFIKRVIDIVLSVVGIIICIPFWIIIPVLIKRDSEGPAFYVQERVGKNGRLFPMYKFRTMVVGADKMQAEVMHLNEMDGPVFKIKDDPRLTKMGKFLRRTSLDELPQLFNVLAGHMSLVGPRPPIMSEVVKYRPWQRKRLSVIPGITCLWQVTGRNEIKFDEWMKLDMQYIDNWSLTLDFKILFMTIKAVISRKGAL